MSVEELMLGAGAIVVAALIYFAGVHRGRRDRAEDREHARKAIEDERREAQKAKCVEEYVRLVRNHVASGPYALARLGLELLGSDAAIRAAIEEMRVRTASNPWGNYEPDVAHVDLVAFFRYVRENAVDFSQTPIRIVADRCRAGV